MPSLNNVSYNSSRIQMAYRINNIETMKLNRRIELMEKERMHRQRLTNQDIRLISLTLDYIQTCSGHSTEGMAPDCEITDEIEKRQNGGPCFLYGERIVSRRQRRNIRPQSAMDKSIGSRQSSETASLVSASEINIRPQSSPNRRKPAFLTNTFRDTESEIGTNSDSTHSGASTPRFKPAWIEEAPSEVTKILLRAASGANTRPSVFERNSRPERTGSSSLKTLTRSLRISSHSVSQSQTSIKSADDKSQQNFPGRGARITDILNTGKASMTAAAWKSHLSHAQTGPVTSTSQRKVIMDSKKAMNSSRTDFLQSRVKNFISN